MVASITSLYLGFANISLKFDKFVHFLVFFLMTLLFYYCFETKNSVQLKVATFLVCTVCAGIGLEFVQSILPYRTFDYNDIACNMIGSLCGLLTCDLYARYLTRRRRLMRLEMIKNLGDEAETLAENYNLRMSGNYSDFSASSRNSMSVYDENGTEEGQSDYYSEVEAAQEASDSRGRSGTTSIELKNVAPVALNDMELV